MFIALIWFEISVIKLSFCKTKCENKMFLSNRLQYCVCVCVCVRTQQVTLCVQVVVLPQRSQFVFPSNVPDGELQIFILHSFHVKA